MSSMLDDAMALHSGKEWVYETHTTPKMAWHSRGEISEPILLSDFLDNSCRNLNEAKVTSIAFDVHKNVPEFSGLAQIGELLSQGNIADVPFPLRLQGPLPPKATMGVIIENHHDGTMSLIKILHFANKITAAAAQRLITGEGFVPVSRPGPWAHRKAVQSLLDRLPGFRVMWASLTKKAPLQRAQSSQWAPDDEALKEGILFINANAPECDSQNEQTYWILCSIKEGSGTPVSGWPEAKVRFMAQNKSRGLAGAQPETDFPLTMFSLKPFMSDVLLPMVMPMLLTYGIMMVGLPGVGKTPCLITLAMAIGRYHVRRLSLTASPGWRRAKSLDNFRHRVPQVQEAVFLDDPSRDKIDLADMKSFLTADEDQTCSGRYNDVRLVRNGMRAYASNDIGEGDEPEDTYRSDIEPDEFFKLLRKTFPESKQADVLAVLKRTIVMVFGQNGLYLRFPSPNYGALVHRIVADDVHKDLLATKDKPVYAAYKLGDMVKGSYYESEVEKEQKIIDEGMMKLQQAGRAQDYVERCNKDLKEALKQVARIPESSFVPTSQSSEDPPLLPPVPLNIGCNAPKRLREGDFIYPDSKPDKRLRHKTSLLISCGGGAASSVASGDPQPQNADQCAEPEELLAAAETADMEDTAADEDASHFLHD